MKTTVFGIMLIVSLIATSIFILGLVEVESSSVPEEPHNADAIWIEPSTVLPPNVGERFNVTLWTNMSVPTSAWQVKMYWNKTYLNLTRLDYTGVGKSQFFTGLPALSISPIIDYVSGWVWHGEALLPPAVRVAGFGSLFWAEFEVLAHPVANVSDALNINNPDTGIFDPNQVIIPTSKYNADLSSIIAPDIAVASVGLLFSSVGQGLSLPINVTVENQGFYQESFTVTVYARSGVTDSLIQTQNVTLQPQTSVELMFVWDKVNFTKGNYTIVAAADILSGEVDTADNEYVDGWVLVTMAGDITGPSGWPDGKCDMRDVGFVARHFGETDP